MKRARTDGMLALGVAHLIVGALGVLFSCGILVGSFGLILARHVAMVPSSIVASIPSRGMTVFAMVLAAMQIAASVVLLVAGIRVLDVAPSGRKLSMIAAFLWTTVNVTAYFAFDFFTYGKSIFVFLAMNAYPIVIELLFLRNDWRDAFTDQPA